MKSIRTYLLTRLLGGSTVLLAAAGLTVYLVVARSMERQLDDNLVARVQGFASLLFQLEDEVVFEFSDELMPEYSDPERPAYFQLWYADGRLLESSESLRDGELALPFGPGPEAQHWTADLPDGRRGRFVTQVIEVHHLYPEEGPGRPTPARVLVVVARGREDLVLAERRVLARCMIAALLLVGLLGGLAWRSVRRGLSPLDRLAESMRGVRMEDLPEGLDVGEVPVELTPVVATTDALIQRAGAALKRERRTTADIAHELRTPVSELLTVSEVALRNKQEVNGSAEALETVRDVASRMGRSVSTLLELARVEGGGRKLTFAPVGIGAVMAELLRSSRALRRERQLEIENDVPEDAEVIGDADAIRIVASNLISNALHYAPEGDTLECRLVSSKEGWKLMVSNRAPGLSPSDLPALSEPFWRKDRARSDRDRSGLGLALSCALAETTGLALSFELEGDVFTATLSGQAGDEASFGNSR